MATGTYPHDPRSTDDDRYAGDPHIHSAHDPAGDDRVAAGRGADLYDPYYDGYHDDDLPDEEPIARRRSGLMTVAAVLGVAAIGTAGAFAYRAFVPDSSTPAPVIKAETAPIKVVPAPAGGDSQSNKLIYDRVGDRGQGDKLVPREEQPLDVREVVKSAPPPVSPSAAGATPPTLVAVPTSSGPAASPAAHEPKKVRTIAIRPDFSVAPSGGDSASRVTTASTSSPPRPAASPRVAPAAGANAPLAIATQGDPGRSAPPAPPAPPAQSAPVRAASLGTGIDSGGFVVQVASQRSENDANESFRALQAKYPNQLGGRRAIIRRADLGSRGVFWRAQVGPFATIEEANDLCSDLKSAGGQCIVQRN